MLRVAFGPDCTRSAVAMTRKDCAGAKNRDGAPPACNLSPDEHRSLTKAPNRERSISTYDPIFSEDLRSKFDLTSRVDDPIVSVE